MQKWRLTGNERIGGRCLVAIIALLLSLQVFAQSTLDLELDDIPLASALQMIAKRAGVNLIVDVPEDAKVTAQLKGVTFEQALELILRPKGLGYKKTDAAYIVAKPEQLAAWESPQEADVPVLAVYSVRFVSTSSLLTTLRRLHPSVTILPGVIPNSPHMGGDNSSEGSASYSGGLAEGGESSQSGGSEAATVSSESETLPQSTRTILIHGLQAQVNTVLQTAQRLDQAPTQIKIEVMVTDVSHNSLKELGVTWDWSTFGAEEVVRLPDKDTIANERLLIPPDRGEYRRTPISIQATLKAMEQKGQAKLLAHPSVSVLNGETAQVLIGDRVLYPVVVGTTTAGTPLFDVREQNVGIVLQVRAISEPEGTITLDIYPQVSIISGYLTVGNSSYPQIATRELRTKIRVKQGALIVLGGLIREEDTYSIQEVPLLSKIPLLGELFKSRRKGSSRNELVIFLRPEVIKDQE